MELGQLPLHSPQPLFTPSIPFLLLSNRISYFPSAPWDRSVLFLVSGLLPFPSPPSLAPSPPSSFSFPLPFSLFPLCHTHLFSHH